MNEHILKVTGHCLTKEQGTKLSQSLIPMLSEKEVLLDFSDVRFLAPSFFYELFGRIFNEESFELVIMRLKRKGLHPTGQNILDKTIRSFIYKIIPEIPKMAIEPNQITIIGGKRIPIIFKTNGIITVIHETGESEWLENTEIISNPEDYEQLLMYYANRADVYRKQNITSNNSSLRCIRCGKQSTTIVGYRKHKRSCLAKAN